MIRRLLSFAVILFCSVLVSFQASAQFASSPCDPEYYKSLESRAWLEAQREITQNQNLIFKPDSVLEYTCFDQQLKELAQHATDMFSENSKHWGQVLGPKSMDNALTSLVGGALATYDGSNFNHKLLGGRYSTEYKPEGEVTGGDYGCNIMQAVWESAKCMDFIDKEGNDGFFTFASYMDAPDKRKYPSACTSRTAQLKEDYAKNIDKTTGGDGKGGKLWQSDDLKTYLDVLFPTSECGSGATSFVRTGLTVRGKSFGTGEYAEHICVVPGCSWNAKANSCE